MLPISLLAGKGIVGFLASHTIQRGVKKPWLISEEVSDTEMENFSR